MAINMEEKIVFCKGGGCTAKLGAGVLSRVLEKLPRGEQDPSLLVGYDSRDDAAVYKISDDTAIVQTLISFHRWWMILIHSTDCCCQCAQRYLCHGRGGQDSAEYCLLP